MFFPSTCWADCAVTETPTAPVCGFDPLNDDHQEALGDALRAVGEAIKELRSATGCSDHFFLMFLDECIDKEQG